MQSISLPFGRLQPYQPLPEDSLRVDYDREDFDAVIAAHGYRLAWQRRADCPCEPSSYQLTQPNPNCTMCEGTGYLYFGPDAAQDLRGERLSEVQAATLGIGKGFLIRGLMAPLSSSDKRNDRLGSWMSGGSSVTVVPENRLGFRDRLINLDAIIPYAEVVLMPSAPTMRLPLRYLVTEGVYLCRDASGRNYREDDDFAVIAGRIYFLPGRAPPEASRIAVVYCTFPCWLVESMTHRDRVQNAVDYDEGDGGPQESPQGYIQRLPTQAQLLLEFIPGPSSRGD